MARCDIYIPYEQLSLKPDLRNGLKSAAIASWCPHMPSSMYHLPHLGLRLLIRVSSDSWSVGQTQFFKIRVVVLSLVRFSGLFYFPPPYHFFRFLGSERLFLVTTYQMLKLCIKPTSSVSQICICLNHPKYSYVYITWNLVRSFSIPHTISNSKITKKC